MRRGIIIAALMVTVGLVIVATFLFTQRDEPQNESVEQVQRVPRLDDDGHRAPGKIERAKPLRDGLPIDYALAQAKTEEQREYLERELAHQRQTKDEAIEQARQKLSEVEGMLASADKEQAAALNRKAKIIRKVIDKLEGREN